MAKKIRGVVSFSLTLLIIILLFLSGPASAVTVSVTSADTVTVGSGITFTVEVAIASPDSYVPLNYTNLTITDPDGTQIRTCKIDLDSTVSGCDDIAVNSVTQDAGLSYSYANGTGYDVTNTTSYNLGYGYGYGSTGSYGSITYSITWTVPPPSSPGTYIAKAEMYAYGNEGTHVYPSSNKEFSVTAASSTSSSSSSGGGGGGGAGDAPATIGEGETKSLGRLSSYGAEREMEHGARIEFTLPNGEKHSATIKEVEEDRAKIEIRSEPQTIIVKLAETINVDVNNDEKADVSIYLKKITAVGNAVIKITRLDDSPKLIKGHKSAEAAELDDSEIDISDGTADQDTRSRYWWAWLIAILALVGIGVGYYFYSTEHWLKK